MFTLIYRSALATTVLALILCGVYPLAVTGVGKIFFPELVRGGVIYRADGQAIGAKLIGQNFNQPQYFHGRPSAAGEQGYDASNSSGSNLGPTHQKLMDAVKGNIQRVLKENPTLQSGQVPVDLVTASGSGLDPHITPEGAMIQVDRVAKSRGLKTEQVAQIVREFIEKPELGVFGEYRVNVLSLNLALERLKNK